MGPPNSREVEKNEEPRPREVLLWPRVHVRKLSASKVENLCDFERKSALKYLVFGTTSDLPIGCCSIERGPFST